MRRLTIAWITINPIKACFTLAFIMSSFTRGRFTRSAFLITSVCFPAKRDTCFRCKINVSRKAGADKVRWLGSFVCGIVYNVHILTDTGSFITCVFILFTSCCKKRKIVKVNECLVKEIVLLCLVRTRLFALSKENLLPLCHGRIF